MCTVQCVRNGILINLLAYTMQVGMVRSSHMKLLQKFKISIINDRESNLKPSIFALINLPKNGMHAKIERF